MNLANAPRTTPNSGNSTPRTTVHDGSMRSTEQSPKDGTDLCSQITAETPLLTQHTESVNNIMCKIISFFKKYNIAVTPLAINATRDFVWSYLTTSNENIYFHATSDVDAKIAAQCIYSLAACCFMGSICFLCNELVKKFHPTLEQFSKMQNLATCFAAVVASGGVVYGWDLVQWRVDTDFSTPQSNVAELISGVGAGILEGPFQGIMTMATIGLMGIFFTSVRDGSPFKDYSWGDYFKKTGFYVFPGMIPGAVWQWTCHLAIAKKFTPTEAALLATMAVFVCNTTCMMIEGKFDKKFITSRNIDTTQLQPDSNC